MPGFSFTTVEPNQLGQVTKWDVPLNDWVGLKFGNGHNDTIGNAFSRATEDFIWDDHNPVRPDIVNGAYGIEGHLKFDKPISMQRARLMHERKRKELESLAYVESASHSWKSAKAVVGFGASLVGGLSHPVDLGLAFLPFIGSEKAAAGVAKLGGGAFKQAINPYRQALARGVFAEESFAGGRLTAAVIDGVVNQAIVEIPVAIQKHRDQAIYGLEDSAFNILAGGAFAGALKGLGLALARAGKLWQDADPRIREAALMDAAKTILTGESPRVHEYFGLDEATIAQKVEAKVRAEFPFRAERVENRSSELSTKLESPVRENGGYTSIVLPDGTAIVGGRIHAQTFNAATELGFSEADVANGIAGFTRKDGTSFDLSGNPVEVKRVVNLSEVPAGASEFSVREPIPEERIASGGEADAIRDQSINDFLAKAKADHESRLQGVIDHETRRVLDEIKTRTPQTPQADIDRYVVKGTPDDASIEAVNKDAADMAEQALNVARTPEERVAMKAQIDKELAEVVTGEKAIDHMIPCVTQRAKI